MSELALRLIAENKKTKDPYLDLGNCGLTQLPPELLDCEWLETLILSNEWWDWEKRTWIKSQNNGKPNKIQVLPPTLPRLLRLKKLVVAGKYDDKWSLSDLSPLQNLNALTYLDFSSNQVSDIKALQNLNALTYLYFRSNQVSDIKALQNLNALTTLDFSSNQVSDIKPLQNLNALTNLDFRFNQVSDIKPLQNLTALTILDFGSNQISELPAFFRNFKKLDGLFLLENKFEVGQEVYDLSPAEKIEAILQWQESRHKDDLRPILEAKVMFIGDSKKGKTHLIEMLLTGKFRKDIPTTHGIERHRLPDVACPQGKVRVNLWDLGGQRFMRSTHQYFFTERTLYVLVAEAREERKDLNHWLQLAKEIGNNSPVLVVVNKIDLDPHDLDRESLQRDYPNIWDFVKTSIYDKPEWGIVALDTIENLRQKISALVGDPQWMPGVYDERPSEWFTVKAELENLEKEEVDFITYSEYEKLQHIRNLQEAERRINLKLLASLGTVVTFEDKLKNIDTQVINPQWLLDGVYKILNDPIVKDERKGLFTYADMERILDDKKSNGEPRFPRTRYPFLLELMQSNGLCYPLEKQKETYLLPDLFSDAEPKDVWGGTDVMRFRYNYDTYPPDAFITRFIVAHHADIVGEKRWRNGVVVSNGACSALVRRAFAREHIEVEVQGPENERREYLAVIRETFRHLHKSYESLKIKREVPYKNVWLDFDHLRNFEKNRKPYFHPELEEDIPVAEILNGYASERDRRGEFPDREFFEEKFDMVERSQRRTRQEVNAGFKKTNKKLDTLLGEIRDTKSLLEANQDNVLQAIEENKVDEGKLEKHLARIQQEMAALTEKIPELANDKDIKAAEKALNTSADLKGKFKITWALLPKLLTDNAALPNLVYEKEIAWNLKDVVQQIVKDFKEGHVFIKERVKNKL